MYRRTAVSQGPTPPRLYPEQRIDDGIGCGPSEQETAVQIAGGPKLRSNGRNDAWVRMWVDFKNRRISLILLDGWRRRRDSNPRDHFWSAHLANECLQPLGHVSALLPVHGSGRHMPEADWVCKYCGEPRGLRPMERPAMDRARIPIQRRDWLKDAR